MAAPDAGSIGHFNPDGSWTWDTGADAGVTIPAAAAQGKLKTELEGYQKGAPAAGQQPQQIGNQVVQGQSFLDDGSINLDPIFKANNISSTSPGGTLNSGLNSQDASQQQSFASALQNQARTGDGAWQQPLAQQTQQASNSAMALGQSRPTLAGAGDTKRDIGNAQGAVGQEAVGQGNILRAQAQQSAQGQLGDLYGKMNGQDATEAINSAGVNQQVREANVANQQKRDQLILGTTAGASALAGAIAGASKGGAVPGKPRVFGDDEKNDVVPAKLSPGEIVLPRSVAQAPDAASAAAAFVAAIKNQKPENKHHFDAGGAVPDVGTQLLNEGHELLFGPPAQDPTQANGAILNSNAFSASRNANNANMAAQQQAALGRGPSAAPQQAQNTMDANTAAAMGGRPGGTGGAASLLNAAHAQQGAAGQAGATGATEALKGQQGFAQAINAQRARDQAYEMARQQAAWKNTELNNNLSLDQIARINNMASGAAQGIGAAVNAFGGSSKGGSAAPADDYSVQKLNESDAPDSSYARGGEVDPYALPERKDDGPHFFSMLAVRPASKLSESDDERPASKLSEDDAYAEGGEVKHTKKSRDFIAALRAQR